MRTLLFSIYALMGGAGLLRAVEDGPIIAVQEELKRQEYLSGPPSGTLDEATVAALRRFQIRHGLKVTGDTNAETLQALAAGAKKVSEPAPASPATTSPAPPAGTAEEEESSARERARSTVVSDREFMDRLEREDSRVRPPAAGAEPSPDPAPKAERREPTTPERREPAVPERRESTLPERREAAETGAGDVRAVIERYIEAAQGPTPEREVSFYGDRVSYFDSGTVTHAFIEKDQARYYRKWPERKFTLLDEPEVLRSSPRGATVRFRMRYALRRGGEAASGGTEEILQLENGSAGYKIVGIRERKISP